MVKAESEKYTFQITNEIIMEYYRFVKLKSHIILGIMHKIATNIPLHKIGNITINWFLEKIPP